MELYVKYKIEKLDKFARKLQEQYEKYRFPVNLKNSNEINENEDIKHLENDGFTTNEIKTMLLLKNSPVIWYIDELTKHVYPNSKEEVRGAIYSLQSKGAPIRDIGNKDCEGWCFDSPRMMIKQYLDNIERSQREIYKIVEFSNGTFYKMLDELDD
ncbi:hypothetical protein ACMGD3_09540 [Lysinibacillus sphaericus]|uniref:hypothetical protein n=1 Tax=Lysinibacillus sphaericus TaxID=1421 RepID=UPI003F7B1352